MFGKSDNKFGNKLFNFFIETAGFVVPVLVVITALMLVSITIFVGTYHF